MLNFFTRSIFNSNNLKDKYNTDQFIAYSRLLIAF